MNSSNNTEEKSAISSTEKPEKNERQRRLRESMPQCYEIVQAFAVFEPRVMEMEEGGIVWKRN